jgi:hypothetical protein
MFRARRRRRGLPEPVDVSQGLNSLLHNNNSFQVKCVDYAVLYSSQVGVGTLKHTLTSDSRSICAVRAQRHELYADYVKLLLESVGVVVWLRERNAQIAAVTL